MPFLWVQVRDDGGSLHGDDEKWYDSGCTLKTQARYAGKPVVDCEKKRGTRMTSQVFWLSLQTCGVPSAGCRGHDGADKGEDWSLRLDLTSVRHLCRGANTQGFVLNMKEKLVGLK